MVTIEDIAWLNFNYPTLTISEDGREIRGVLTYRATYDKETNQFLVLSAGITNTIGGIELKASYEINIKARVGADNKIYALPSLFITIEVEKLILDRHFNTIDKAACLCGPVEELNYMRSYSFQEYFTRLVIPFLYEQTYFDLYQGKWPWGEYGHGFFGMMASYNESGNASHIPQLLARMKDETNIWDKVIKLLLTQKPDLKGHILCFCGSREYFRNCHKSTMFGVNKLRKDIRENNIQIPE